MQRCLKRINLSKLAKRVVDKNGKEGSKVATSSNTGVVIREKRPRDEVQNLVADNSKGKEASPPSEAKKAKPSKAASRGVMPPITPRGKSSKRPSSKKPSEVLGKVTSVYASPSVAEKIFSGVILPVDREKVNKLSLDQVVTKFFHVLDQGIMLGSSLAGVGTWGMMPLSSSKACQSGESKKVGSELKKRNEDVARLETEVAELWKNEASAKENAIKEYKALDDFHEAVENFSLKYFGEGFDFCKRQLAHHCPNLGIDLDNMGLDHDLLTEEEEEDVDSIP
ncbi:hypothetical protein Acr_08g0011930 [Actinidia rufa]|uniref:Uncharacterized protein n=1 Tax=Actinidia rufa TaxID=165716 RepID=A0A7J0F4E5_9ERIC|nr:hypothetical protein Acr_08g0011930 [Actinidia rufa]